MKKLFVLVILLASFVSVTMAQKGVATLKFSALTEATAQTGYVMLGDWSRIDSMGLSLASYGIVDVDSVVCYAAYQVPGVGLFYSATALTSICDLDVNTAIKGWTGACGTAAAAVSPTVLTKAALKGANALKVVIYPADGCTPTGQYVYCVFQIWGVPN